MAVTFGKKAEAKSVKAKPAGGKITSPKLALEQMAAKKTPDSATAELVDTYIALLPQVAALMKDPRVAQLAEVTEQLHALAEKKPATAEVTLMGTSGDGVVLGKKGLVRTFKDDGMEKAKKFMGTETFMAVATIGLKAIDDYTTPKQREEILHSEFSGKRKIKVITK